MCELAAGAIFGVRTNDFAQEVIQMLDEATQTEQRVRLHVWHHKVHVMHVAHMKAAVVCDRLGRGFGVFAAILATFTGTTWASDLTAVAGPSDVMLWIAAIAGILSGVLVAINSDQPLEAVW